MLTRALIIKIKNISHLDVSIRHEYVIDISILIPRGRFIVEVNAWDQLSMDGTNHIFQCSRGSEVVRKSNHLRPIYRLYVPDHHSYIMQQFPLVPWHHSASSSSLITGPVFDAGKKVGDAVLKAATMNPSAQNSQVTDVMRMIVSEDSSSQVRSNFLWPSVNTEDVSQLGHKCGKCNLNAT